MENLALDPVSILLGGLFFVFFIAIFIVFLITQQKTLGSIQPQNRMMAPGKVYLQLIPLFGLVWQYFVVSRIARSIQNELDSANTFSFENANEISIRSGQMPTQAIGITYCILFTLSVIPIVGTFMGLPGMVCWIIYWVKLANYKNQLQKLQLLRLETAVTLS